MSIRKARLMGVGLVLLLLVGVGWSENPPDECDSTLVVPSSVMGSAGGEQIVKAVQSLEHQGADVRIRVLESTSDPTLDVTEKRLEAQCPSWRSPDGGRKNNLITYIVALKNHRTGIYYGDQWTEQLSGQHRHIRDRVMNPRFRDRDFVGGIVAGVNETATVLGNMSADAGKTAGVVVNQGPAEPTDYSGLWKVLAWIVGLGFLLTTIILLARAWSQRRQAANQREATRVSALSMITRCSRLIDSLKDGVPAWELTEKDTTKVATAKRLIDQAVRSFSTLSTSLPDPSEQKDLPPEIYESIRVQFASVYDQLAQAEMLVTGVTDKVPYSRGIAEVHHYSSGPISSHKSKAQAESHDSHDDHSSHEPSSVIPIPIPVSEPERRTSVFDHDRDDSSSRSSGGSSSDWGSSSSSGSDSGWGSSSSGGSDSGFGSGGGGGGDSSW